MEKRIQAGWNNWRKLTGVLCNKCVPLRVKSRIYKLMVLPAMMYGLETAAITKRTRGKLKTNRNEEVRKKLNTGEVSTKLREVRLQWAGHVWRKQESYVGMKSVGDDCGKAMERQAKRRWKDSIKEDMVALGLVEEDAQDRVIWRQHICTSNPA